LELTKVLFFFKEQDGRASANAKHGLSVFAAAILIAGEMAGSGVLALPKAVVDAGI
jgi:amino acid permease